MESNIWHNKSEKPDKGEDILIKTVMGGYAIGNITYPWDSVNSWCYIKDIDK